MIKYKRLNEASLPKMDVLIKDIEKMVDNNADGIMVEYLAKSFKYTKHEKIMKNINAIHSLEKSMPPSLRKYRDEVLSEVMGYIKKDHGEEIAKQINLAM